MPDSITISHPDPGSTVPPGQQFDGTYTLSNPALFNKIVCRIVFPPATLLPSLPVEMNAIRDVPNPGDWKATFAALPEGLDTTFTAELYTGPAAGVLQDTDTLEDVDIVAGVGGGAGTIGTIGVITLLPTPIIPTP